jgi:hypothetical protein
MAWNSVDLAQLARIVLVKVAGYCEHRKEMNERKINLMQLLYRFIVAVGDALHVSGVFAHHQER